MTCGQEDAVRGRAPTVWTGADAVALQQAMRCSVRDFAQQLGVEVTTVANWRARGRDVTLRPFTQQLLDVALERADPGIRSRFFAHTESASGTAQPDGDLFDEVVDIVKQTEFADRITEDPAVLDLIELAATDIVERYETQGPQHFAGETAALHRRVLALVRAQPDPQIQRRAFGLLGRIAGLLGYMAVDCGRFRHAKVYCRQAFTMGKISGDAPLLAWVRATESDCAYYQHDFAAARQLALDGIRLGGTGPQGVRLHANSLARALARMGDARGADSAIASAMAIAGDVQAPAGLTPAMSFEADGVALVLADTLTVELALNRFTRTFDQASKLNPLVATSDWQKAIARLDLATAHARHRGGDLRYAMQLAGDALAATEKRPIRPIWQRAHELADTVKGRETPETTEYGRKLREWSAAAQRTWNHRITPQPARTRR